MCPKTHSEILVRVKSHLDPKVPFFQNTWIGHAIHHFLSKFQGEFDKRISNTNSGHQNEKRPLAYTALYKILLFPNIGIGVTIPFSF